jgi:hypothetical protein
MRLAEEAIERQTPKTSSCLQTKSVAENFITCKDEVTFPPIGASSAMSNRLYNITAYPQQLSITTRLARFQFIPWTIQFHRQVRSKHTTLTD